MIFVGSLIYRYKDMHMMKWKNEDVVSYVTYPSLCKEAKLPQFLALEKGNSQRATINTENVVGSESHFLITSDQSISSPFIKLQLP